MPSYLKRAIGAAESDAADAKVRETVEGIIADVHQRGDLAVRELSERLDRWSPPSFRLSRSEIDALLASVSPKTIEDIKFAQAQISRFAQSVERREM